MDSLFRELKIYASRGQLYQPVDAAMLLAYVEGKDGQPTKESAYFLSANRNKRSVTVNVATPEGQALIKRLAAKCDVLVQNYKVGGLKKYGLAY